MEASRIFETVLYADNLDAVRGFYEEVLGLEVVSASELMLAYRCGDGMLLIFDPERSAKPGREVPSHGADGPGHLAFAARAGDLQSWRAHLAENGVDIELEVEWGSGGTSIYFRDPAGNSLELAAPTLWGGGWEF